MIARLLAAWAEVVITRPRAVLVGLGLVTLGACVCLPRLRLAPDVNAFLPEGDLGIALHGAAGPGASASRELFVLLEGEGIEAKLPALGESLRASPYLERVAVTRDELFGELRTAAAETPLAWLPEDALRDLETRLAPAGRRRALEAGRAAFASDPLGGRELFVRDPLSLRRILSAAGDTLVPAALRSASPYLIQREGTLALVSVRGKEEPTRVDFSKRLLADLEERLDSVRPAFFGGYATARADATRIEHDIRSSTIASVVLVLLFLLVTTRSFVLPHLLFVPVALAIFYALAYGGAWLGPLTPLAISATAILTGLGVDFTLHYAERYAEARRGSDHAGAVRIASVCTGRASLAALATSVAAFVCFASGSFPELRRFGALLALGLVAAFVTTMTLFPLLARHARAAERGAPPARVVALARRFVAWPRAGWLVALALAASLVGWGLVLVHGLDFDADPARLRPADDPAALAADRIQAALGFTPLPVLVLVPAERSLDDVAAACEELRANGDVALVHGAVAGHVSADRRARAQAFRARTANWVEDTLADLADAGLQPAPFRAGLEEWNARFSAELDDEASHATVSVAGEPHWRVAVHPTGDLNDAAHRATVHATLRRVFPDARLVDPYGLSELVLPILEHELRRALLWIAACLVVLLTAFLRRPRAIALALLPVTAGFGILFGALIVLGIPLHPGNVIAVPLILGLGVDDGVHLVARWLENRGDALTATGSAIWRTSCTSALGFGSLITAASPAIASLGLLVLIGVAATFVTSLFVLPRVLVGSSPSRASSRA